MAHFRPKIEAEKDEILSQYLQDVIRRHQSSVSELRHPDIYSNYEFRVILEFMLQEAFIQITNFKF
jgi:hypothetical protein